MTREIKYSEAIREATDQCMSRDDSIFIIGEGVPDPARIFGTTAGLKEKYGPRVLDMPLSENGMTGVCIGSALTGMRPILTHQRIDFALLSMDQLVNNAAKWHYMFGGQNSVPLVVRVIIGRGWGQGAQHSQNIQALFAHIPGLKVVMPSTAHDAKGLLISSIKDNNPVIFIEHRWLHNTLSEVPEEVYEVPIGKAKVAKEGTDLTIVSSSYYTIEALKAAEHLKKAGVSAEVIDLRTIKPLDEETILKSVKKTGNLLVVDSGYYSGGISGDIISRVSEKAFKYLKSSPKRITLPDIPTPTTVGLTKYYYPRVKDIARKAGEILGKDLDMSGIEDPRSWDQPDPTFTGPF